MGSAGGGNWDGGKLEGEAEMSIRAGSIAIGWPGAEPGRGPLGELEDEDPLTILSLRIRLRDPAIDEGLGRALF
jgi:hypothetical protein